MQNYMLKVLRVGEPGPSMRVDSPEIAQRYWNKVIKRQDWFDENKEHLVVLLLSTKYSIQGYSLVSIGSVNESIAHPREIFRAAVAVGAYGIIVLHNHPSGDPMPSGHDKALTERLIKCGDLLGIPVIDHVIIGRPNRQISVEICATAETLVKRLSRGGRRLKQTLSTSRQGYYSFKEMGIL